MFDLRNWNSPFDSAQARCGIELGTSTNNAADYCLVYNYYQGAGNPTSCATPGQATSGNNGSVAGYYYDDPVHSSLTHAVTYTYDAANRLFTAATTSSAWGYQFGYDRYGNLSGMALTKGSGPTLSISVSGATNQVNSPGYSYDAGGDMTNDYYNTFTYDAEGRIATSSNGGAISYTWNALGQWVQFSNSAGGGASPYDVNGQFLGLYTFGDSSWTDFYV